MRITIDIDTTDADRVQQIADSFEALFRTLVPEDTAIHVEEGAFRTSGNSALWRIFRSAEGMSATLYKRPTSAELTRYVDTIMMRTLMTGHKIQAIKECRDEYGLSLKGAKYFVDWVAAYYKMP